MIQFNDILSHYQKLSKSGRVLIWITIINIVAWLVDLLNFMNLWFGYVLMILAMLIFSAYCVWLILLKYDEKGFDKMIILYALGLVSWYSPHFIVDFSGLISLKFGFENRIMVSEGVFTGYALQFNILSLIFMHYSAKNSRFMSIQNSFIAPNPNQETSPLELESESSSEKN